MIISFYYRYISLIWKVFKYSHIKIISLYYFNYYVINICYHLWFFFFFFIKYNTLYYRIFFVIFWFHPIFLQYLFSVNIFISVKSKKFLMKGIKIFYDIMLQCGVFQLLFKSLLKYIKYESSRERGWAISKRDWVWNMEINKYE